MAIIHGRLSNVTFSGSAVGGIIDASFSGSRAELDSTEHDDAARTYISGRMDATVDLSLHWDEADSGQGALADNWFNNTGAEALVFRMQTAGGAHSYTANAFVTSWNPSGPNDDTGKVSCTLRISGAVTQATQ